jgi:hypothetical protein
MHTSPVETPQVQIIGKGAARRKILGNRPSLASVLKNVHDPVYDLRHVDPAFIAAILGGWDHRLDAGPFVIGPVTRISQLAAVISPAVFRRPHSHAPPNHPTTEGIIRSAPADKP